MKKIVLFIQATLIILTVLFPIIDIFANEPELPLSTSNWSPFVSKEIEGYGVFTEVVTAVVKEIGMTPKYRFSPWKRGEYETRRGEVFGTFPYRITEARGKDFFFSHAIMVNETKLFYNKQHLKSEPVFNQLADLKPYEILGVLGYSYVKDFEKSGLRVVYVASDEQLVGMLLLNRGDLAPLNTLVGWELINTLYPKEKSKFGTLKKPLYVSDMHMMISKSYPNAQKILNQFNSALKQIKANGLYDQIMEKHGFSQ